MIIKAKASRVRRRERICRCCMKKARKTAEIAIGWMDRSRAGVIATGVLFQSSVYKTAASSLASVAVGGRG